MNEILVASGSLAVRMDLDEAMATNGFIYMTVSTARQARATLEQGTTSMLVLDPVLRDGDGMRLLAEVRENPRYRSLPILLLCTEDDSERFGDSDIGWEHCEFLGKPYDKDHLLERASQYASKLNTQTGEALRPKLLIIDPDELYTKKMKSRLDVSGFDLVSATDRTSAREKMQVHKFDAILLDDRILERSIGNLRRWVRTSGQLATAAIIVLTQADTKDAMLRVFSSGADDYVVKSDNFEGLLGRLRAQMRRKQAENENRRMREALLIKAMQTTEAERARRNAEARAALLAELETKNTELERARIEAEAGAAAKSAFLASMSHEIRTPMNAILGMAELLDAEERNPEKRQRLDVIRSSGAHLLTLIDQILDFSKIEAGKMEIEMGPVDIRACVEDALEIVAFQAAQKSLDLAYVIDDDVPAGILGDIGRIRQVLINFLGNAVKFTESGEVVVHVGTAPATEHAEVELIFSVKDTGIGIGEDQIDKLFKTFSQLDHSSRRRYGGTGLGLAISRRLVEMMGGEVSCSSRPNEGSIFSFNIPANRIGIPSIPAERNSRLLRGKRVLIVDDNETAREVLCGHVRHWGGEAITASSAEQTLKLLESAPSIFDLVLIDLMLGDDNGLELGAQIRSAHPKQLMLLVSSVSNSMVTTPDFEAFVAKPIRQAALYDTLHRIMQATASPEATDEAATHTAASRDGEQNALLDTQDALPEIDVLLVEDNALNRQVAQLMLAKLGVRVTLAESGEAAVALTHHHAFDVILMDINMPEMDGVEATREILTLLSKRNFPSPKIVALTASALSEDRERCLAAGMTDFVSKPVSSNGLREALERATRAA